MQHKNGRPIEKEWKDKITLRLPLNLPTKIRMTYASLCLQPNLIVGVASMFCSLRFIREGLLLSQKDKMLILSAKYH